MPLLLLYVCFRFVCDAWVDLLATSEQVEELRREGYHQALAAAAAAAGKRSRVVQPEQQRQQQLQRRRLPRRQLLQQPGNEQAAASSCQLLSTDVLWQQLQEVQDACVNAGRWQGRVM